MNQQSYEHIENALIDLGLDVIEANKTLVRFWYNDNVIIYYMKRQWATGKGINDCRGWNSLYNQLKKNENRK